MVGSGGTTRVRFLTFWLASVVDVVDDVAMTVVDDVDDVAMTVVLALERVQAVDVVVVLRVRLALPKMDDRRIDLSRSSSCCFP